VAELLSQILGPSGSFAVLFGSIYGAFAVCDANTSKQVRADYALVLKTGKYINLFNALPAAVLSIFEQLFGHTHVSLKCFRRSAYVSLVSVALLFTLSELHGSFHVRWLFYRDWLFGWDINLYVLTYAAWSVLQDYINLAKTRSLLKIFNFSKRRRLFVLIAVAVGDLIIWIIIFWATTFLLFILIDIAARENHRQYVDWSGLLSWHYLSTTAIPAAIPDLFSSDVPAVVANYFWTGMVPSMWLWLNLVASCMTILMNKSSRVFELLFYMLDVEEHPVRSVGFVAASIITGIYGVRVIIGRLFS
jgi:hypothetical protein